jgi:hypothetical protein
MIVRNDTDGEIIWFLCNARVLLIHTYPNLKKNVITYRQQASIGTYSRAFRSCFFFSFPVELQRKKSTGVRRERQNWSGSVADEKTDLPEKVKKENIKGPFTNISRLYERNYTYFQSYLYAGSNECSFPHKLQ